MRVTTPTAELAVIQSQLCKINERQYTTWLSGVSVLLLLRRHPAHAGAPRRLETATMHVVETKLAMNTSAPCAAPDAMLLTHKFIAASALQIYAAGTFSC